MEKFTLDATLRDTSEKMRQIKDNKKLAGVVYGKNQESTPIIIDYSLFLKTFRKTGESHIITLNFKRKKIEVLVHDVQREPVTGDFIHIDFFAITKGEKVHTKIPLLFIGESKAVKEGNIIEEHLKEVEIKCLPVDLVDNFPVDLTKLEKKGDAIRVSELDIPTNKYTLLNKEDEVVVIVIKPAKIKITEDIEVKEEVNTKGESETEQTDEK